MALKTPLNPLAKPLPCFRLALSVRLASGFASLLHILAAACAIPSEPPPLASPKLGECGGGDGWLANSLGDPLELLITKYL